MGEQQQVVRIALAQLRAHPANSNVMKESLLAKLAEHIAASGQYPPIIVRRWGQFINPAEYQVLDGHHRWKALERLGRTEAMCVVWEADDEQALVLLATLNRLQGQDDPRKRAELLTRLHEQFGRTAAELGRWLPEAREDLRKLLGLGNEVKLPAMKRVKEQDLPGSVFFFLDAAQRGRLDEALQRMGGSREEGLMAMVERVLG